ncbi:MAG: hypothetical protein LC798_13425 [Chloroflexi bacterium]|nr:hypothetical protein [Chloroflexota bacterium]
MSHPKGEPLNEHTQALLDELASPSVVGLPDAQREIVDALDALERVDAQCARLDALFRRAQLSEERGAVRGQFEMGRQTVGAMRRIVADWKRATDDLVLTFDQMRAWLNGVEEEKQVPDPEAHEAIRQKAKRAIAKARQKAPDAADDVEEVVNDLLPALNVLLTRGAPQKVRTAGLRSVAAEAGYETRGRKPPKARKK